MEVVIFEGKAFQARYFEHKVVWRVLTCFFPKAFLSYVDRDLSSHIE